MARDRQDEGTSVAKSRRKHIVGIGARLFLHVTDDSLEKWEEMLKDC